MKKLLCAVLLLTTLLCIVSCGDEEYPPVKSSADELKTVYTANYDDEKYEIPYELYRAFFLTLKSSYDGGDASVWSGEDSASYVEAIDKEIKNNISIIYSVLHHAEKIGIDAYSEEFEEQIREYVKTEVEGGLLGSLLVDGFGGDYDKYLQHLKSMNLNYSVQTLLYRYSLASTAIYNYYKGNMDSEEHAENVNMPSIKYTKEDVKAFYDSTESVRVIKAYLPTDYFTKERAQEIRDAIAKLGSEEEVATYIINYSTAPGSEIKAGELIGRNNLDRSYYAEYTDTAFALSHFETSEVIEINTGADSGYVIFYKTLKTDAHFEDNYDYCKDVYLDNEIGKRIDETAKGIFDALAESDYLSELDRANIKMD